MRVRLFLLLIVTIVCGLVAGFVGNATASKRGRRGDGGTRRGTVFVAGRCPIPAAYRSAFLAASADTSLPLALLYAVAKVESDLRPDVSSSAGARGLLQLMPATARSLDLDANEIASNVLGGARYLRQMLDRFQSTDLALAAYNAGPTRVATAGGIPDTRTATYVTRVTSIWRTLNGCA
jgi:soluble lytic murein transglycosylase-like protein